jgi:site-specific DNA-cytosine methylase
MSDPHAPHFVPSSPCCIDSSDAETDLFDDVPADVTADSRPIFGTELADAETVHPSIQSQIGLDRSNWTYPDSSFETQYLKLRSTKVLEEIQYGEATPWTQWLMDSLNHLQRANLLMRQLVRYGDDCSGARAPLEALCQLVTRLELEGCSMNIEDLFASECPGKAGDGPRAFIDAQHGGGPSIMFSTVHRGKELRGLDMRTGKHVDIPANLTVYCAGWVCRDVSTVNQHRKELLSGTHRKVKAGKAGASSQTLDSSLLYIDTHRPCIVLLENLTFKLNRVIPIRALMAMRGYSTCVLLIDSRTFHVSMSRRRMYILAIRTEWLTAPLGKFVLQLKDIAKKIPPLATGNLVKMLDPPTQQSALDRLQLLLDTGEKMRKHDQWKNDHDRLRTPLKLDSRSEIVNKVKAHSPMAASLPLRMQELLGMHWDVSMQNGILPGEHHFVWDLTNSATFGSCAKDPRLAGVVPCALRGHCLWNTAQRRPISGPELMKVHGFFLEPKAMQMDNRIIGALAGDTMSVPPVGCILGLALTYIAPSEHYLPTAALTDHHVPDAWIGPSSWRGFDRKLDHLMPLAGICAKPKARSSKCKLQDRLRARSTRSKIARSAGNIDCRQDRSWA